MNFLRAAGRGLSLFVLTISVSAWLGAAVLQTTLLDRQVVKGWLAKSGVYQNFLNSAVSIQPQTGGQNQAHFITPGVIGQALNSTFPKEYIHTSSEQLLDSIYDWLEGKSAVIAFSIPVQDKRSEFTNNLATATEPHVAQLPTCQGVSSGQCLPPGVTANQFASQLAEQAMQNTDFLNQPLSSQAVGINSQSQPPTIKSTVNLLLWILPLAAFIAGAGYIVLHEPRSRGMVRLGRRLVFGGASSLALGLLAVFGASILNDSAVFAQAPLDEKSVLQGIVSPLLGRAMPDIGTSLALASTPLIALGAALWILGEIIYKRRIKASLLRSQEPAEPGAPMQQIKN